MLHEDMKFHFEGFPHGAPDGDSVLDDQRRQLFSSRLDFARTRTFEVQSARLLSQVRTIAAFAYRKSHGLPIIYPKPIYKYTANFLHMMFSEPYEDYDLKPEVVQALDLIFLLHADHEQNCSTSTVRMVASSRANFCLRGRRRVRAVGPAPRRRQPGGHRDAEQIHDEGDDGSKFIEAAKDKNSGKSHGFRPPRLQKLRSARQDHQGSLRQNPGRCCNINDPLLDIAKKLEEAALHDTYFVERKLYPERGFLQRHHHARHRDSDRDVHRDVRHRPHAGLDREL